MLGPTPTRDRKVKGNIMFEISGNILQKLQQTGFEIVLFKHEPNKLRITLRNANTSLFFYQRFDEDGKIDDVSYVSACLLKHVVDGSYVSEDSIGFTELQNIHDLNKWLHNYWKKHEIII